MTAAVDGGAGVPRAPLALWGGFECSVTRLGEVWRDQIRETGHHRRLSDLAAAASLGVSVLRYPFLWERFEGPSASDEIAWQDARMAELRRLGLGVVAGLVHHGSGPVGTDLLDPGFPELLARHAARVADRYPDVAGWTPINEPLTTARFSCLYGVWYPHCHDTDAFFRATVIQCHAVLRAMRAIRARLPNARLVQTEDVTRTFATRPLQAQADYENERRWLSLDLLCGRVDRSHPFHAALCAAGADESVLAELGTGEATPDVIAANYYVTSERFLDNRTAFYPARLHGGNGPQAYADIEAVRVDLPDNSTGWLPRLREVWQRYQLPMVVGEAQLGCDDDAEQARWFAEAWDAATALRAEGADLRAVTAWALAGATDWDSLMRERRGSFECGAWEGEPALSRPRLLGRMLPVLARGETFDDAALLSRGWWHREERFHARRRHA